MQKFRQTNEKIRLFPKIPSILRKFCRSKLKERGKVGILNHFDLTKKIIPSYNFIQRYYLIGGKDDFLLKNFLENKKKPMHKKSFQAFFNVTSTFLFNFS